VVPKQLAEMMSSGDARKGTAMTKAMLKMSKLDIAELKRAYDAG
jgi:predicted 3-demethylubiquinone-9 3-methyltransferase (glyoxalase superfamily)